MNEIEKAIETLQDIHDVAEARMGAGDSRGLVYIPKDKLHDIKTAITALEVQKDDTWIPITVRLPECEYGCESKEVLYQLKNTGSIEVGYYGCGGKYRDKYFRHLRDSAEGVDVSDVIAWKPLPKPYDPLAEGIKRVLDREHDRISGKE